MDLSGLYPYIVMLTLAAWFFERARPGLSLAALILAAVLAGAIFIGHLAVHL